MKIIRIDIQRSVSASPPKPNADEFALVVVIAGGGTRPEAATI